MKFFFVFYILHIFFLPWFYRNNLFDRLLGGAEVPAAPDEGVPGRLPWRYHKEHCRYCFITIFFYEWRQFSPKIFKIHFRLS